MISVLMTIQHVSYDKCRKSKLKETYLDVSEPYYSPQIFDDSDARC